VTSDGRGVSLYLLGAPRAAALRTIRGRRAVLTRHSNSGPHPSQVRADFEGRGAHSLARQGMGYAHGAQDSTQQVGSSPGQAIFDDTGAREPEHTFRQPMPVVAHVV
jgi:hypothetical protein